MPCQTATSPTRSTSKSSRSAVLVRPITPPPHKVIYRWETLTEVFEKVGFEVRLLEWCDDNGTFHSTSWDEEDGFIYRSARFDHHNQDGMLGFVSLILDAVKPFTNS